jgi:asparagine synthase (glutamine-hydrolysing)
MFAFAIWDDDKQQLFMARDRFGKKPLVYAEVDGALIFASELKALLKYPGIHKDIDYSAIDLYLSLQYIPSPWTIFKQIRKLPAAHRLIWKKDRVRVHRYQINVENWAVWVLLWHRRYSSSKGYRASIDQPESQSG